MLRSFHNSRGSSTRARKQTPGWRLQFIVLMLVLTFGVAGQILPAQASPARDPITISMNVVSPKTTICIGQSAFYEVQVIRAPTTSGSFTFEAFALSGITVDASSADSSVGDFIGGKNKSIVSRKTGSWDELDSLEQDLERNTSDDLPARSNSASFQFKAKKTGRTTLYFEGLAYGQYVSFNVPVKVIVCKFEVSTNSVWVYEGKYGTAFFFEFMKTLVTGDDGGSFSSSDSLTVLWIGTEFVPNYGSNVTINKGSAKLRGQIDESNQLALNIAFDPVTDSEKSCGAAGCGGGSYTLTSAPVDFSIPQSGGSDTVWHALDGAGQKAPGYTTVKVKPLDASK